MTMKLPIEKGFWAKLSTVLGINKVTLKDMSEDLNINYSTLMTKKKRDQLPSFTDLQKIAAYLKLPIDRLYADDWMPYYLIDKATINSDGFVDMPHYDNDELLSNGQESGLIKIPFIPQKISAGYGEELLNPEDVEIKTINIMESLARGVPRDSLLAARVKGDSMIDVYIYPDDIVVFAKGIISGDGIYVLSIDNEVMVKRLVFDRLNHSVLIISENKKYPQREAKDDNQSLRILGKVVGWIHANSV